MAFLNPRQSVFSPVISECKAHLFYAAVYYHGCRVWLFHIFPHSHNGLDFRKSVTKHNVCVLSFSTIYVWSISHSKKNSARYYHKCKYVLHKILVIFCQILMKHFLEKISNNMKIRGSRDVPRGKKDMTKPTVAFRNFVHAQNKMGIQERNCDCIYTRQIYMYQIFFTELC